MALVCKDLRHLPHLFCLLKLSDYKLVVAFDLKSLQKDFVFPFFYFNLFYLVLRVAKTTNIKGYRGQLGYKTRRLCTKTRKVMYKNKKGYVQKQEGYVINNICYIIQFLHQCIITFTNHER